jgi:uncharacterized protein
MGDTSSLICPKCRGEMRRYERNGIQVDQCEECRGIFLDRGELEQLLDAEGSRGRDDEFESRRDERHHGSDHDEGEHRQARRRTSASSLIADLLGGGE